MTGLRCLDWQREGHASFCCVIRYTGANGEHCSGGTIPRWMSARLVARARLPKRKIAEGVDQQVKEGPAQPEDPEQFVSGRTISYLQSHEITQLETDEHHFRNHLRPIFGNLIPEEITVTRIQNMQQMLLKRLTRPPAIEY